MKIEGTVDVEAVITATGTVEKVNIVGGNPVLTRPAVEAVKSWKFTPFTSAAPRQPRTLPSRDGNARLDRMAASVRALLQSSGKVKCLVDESRGMDQIARAVVHMEQVTQTTAASAGEGASAGAELDGYAGTLRALVREMRRMVDTA